VNVGIDDLPFHLAGFLRLPAVRDHGPQFEGRSAVLHVRADVALPLRQMQLVLLNQPDVPVDTGALVEPSVAEARVEAHHQIVLSAVVGKVRNIKGEGRVTVIISADKTAVQEHQSAAERAVELQADATAPVACRKIEAAAVPTDAGLRIFASQRLVAVGLQIVVPHERQLHGPVVRQVQRSPA
jgi:hypothetical protein